MADIFREIDEDLRRDRLNELWRRYANLVYAAAALIVVGTAATVWWQNHQRSQAESLGAQFAGADAMATADPAKAAAALEVLGSQGDSGYRLLARFRAAGLKLKSGDKVAGHAALKAIAADSGVDQAYRDLATIEDALASVDDAPPADVEKAVQSLTVASGPWRFTALEVTALAQFKGGDKAGSLKTYQQIADDLDAPPSLRQRAAEIVEALSHQG